MSDARRAVAVDRGRSEGEAVTDARRAAEEALEHYATCPGEGRWRECSSSLASALRALLAEQTEAGGELISCPACNMVVGRTDAPAPSPARDEVREAAEEWAAAEAEYDAVPAYSRDTDAFARNMFRRQSARRRLLAALSRDAKGGE